MVKTEEDRFKRTRTQSQHISRMHRNSRSLRLTRVNPSRKSWASPNFSKTGNHQIICLIAVTNMRVSTLPIITSSNTSNPKQKYHRRSRKSKGSKQLSRATTIKLTRRRCCQAKSTTSRSTRLGNRWTSSSTRPTKWELSSMRLKTNGFPSSKNIGYWRKATANWESRMNKIA